MLEAARQRKLEGIDVVIGYLETHKRVETERIAQGLETIPRKSITYHGVTLAEMDADAILARHPKLALVDELAHTNAPGSRHPKRYLDVEELLEAGIDVYSTLNVQHIESLNDVVAQITGVLVQETIPDRVIDEANELELVDLPPEELIDAFAGGQSLCSRSSRARDSGFLSQRESHCPARDDHAPRARNASMIRCVPICRRRLLPARGQRLSVCLFVSVPIRWESNSFDRTPPRG